MPFRFDPPALRLCSFVAVLLVALAGTQGLAAPPAPPAEKGPVVFADSSLRPALDPIAAAWVARGRPAPSITYDASAALAKVIAAGTPADVFFAADPKVMDGLVRDGFVDGRTRNNFVANELVVIAPSDSATSLKIFSGVDLSGALGTSRIAVCATDSCIAGLYTKQALQTFRIWDKIEPKLAPAPDLISTVAMVATGISPFGIVYASDAKAEPKVRVTDILPTSTHDLIAYPIALVKSAKNPNAALFEAFMRSGEATRIFLGLGYTVLK